MPELSWVIHVWSLNQAWFPALQGENKAVLRWLAAWELPLARPRGEPCGSARPHRGCTGWGMGASTRRCSRRAAVPSLVRWLAPSLLRHLSQHHVQTKDQASSLSALFFFLMLSLFLPFKCGSCNYRAQNPNFQRSVTTIKWIQKPDEWFHLLPF